MQSQTMMVASLLGGVAFALSGFIAGAKKQLDWVGIFILAFLTANGGGILRDVLVGRLPVALSSNGPFLLVFTVTALGIVFRLHRYSAYQNRWLFIVCDAVGLAAFSITGALVASATNAPFFGYIMLAFLTATGGGILRDMLVNEVPEILHTGFYGSVAILIATAMFLLEKAEAATPLNLLIVAVGGLIVRLVAYRYRWQLPRA